MGKTASKRSAPKSGPTPSRGDHARARAEQARRGRRQWVLSAVVAALLVIAVIALLAAVLPPLDGVPLRRHR
jgi:hypothetical protein